MIEHPVTVDATWTCTIRAHDLDSGGVVTVILDGNVVNLIKLLPDICSTAAIELMNKRGLDD